MKKIQQYFTSGLLFLVPVWILYVVIKGIAGLVTDLVQINILIAFVVSVATITLFGFALNRVFKRYLKDRFARWGQQSTLWGLVCRTVSQFDFLSDKARGAFHNPVLYKVDDGIYKLGFITDHDMDILWFADEDETEVTPTDDAVWVYAPYPVTMLGELILVEQRKIKKLSAKETEAIPLFIMTAGLIERN